MSVAPLRVGVDATPLLGQRTGIGRYVEHLLDALLLNDRLDIIATAFSLRGLGALPRAVPEGVRTFARPFPANLAQRLWMRNELFTVDRVSGLHARVFHGTNFVLPPQRPERSGVLTIHDLAYLRLPQTVDAVSQRFRTLVPRGIKRAEVIVTPSRATADDVMDAYDVAPDRVIVTPLGVEPAWFAAEPPDAAWRAAHGIPSEYLLAVGRLEPRKGLDVLLDAYRLLQDRGVDVPLVICGPPGWGPALDRAGIRPDRFVATGWLDTDALRPLVAGARCLAFPSRYEGFGLPPLEALACGTAVVASDLAVSREVLGVHARYAAVEDVEGLADAIARTLSDGGPTPPEARRAHAGTFTWQACAAATATAYERAASS
ncbi:MAG TPA: glycosyltransferase family 1 protein [Mycobacteriales bacterium]|nr:glycosyltransferase family 1 protein [Mycobacteriales bacterium]